MTEVVCLHSKDEVEGFCRRNPALHVYALGDLDDFFWPCTTWYALREGGQVQQLVLCYGGQPVPTVTPVSTPWRPSRRRTAPKLAGETDPRGARARFRPYTPAIGSVVATSCQLVP